jgi:hypothetical protein
MKPMKIPSDLGGHRDSPNPMKMCHLFLGAVALVLAAGCHHQMASAPQAPAPISTPTASTELTVPLPAKTPFDGNPKARSAYLEYYAMGYQLAVTAEDYASPGCLCTAEGDAERYEATVSGFYAGKDAGSSALAKIRQQNQVVRADISGTPPVTPPSDQR